MSTFSVSHCAIMLADLSGSSALFLNQGNMAATQQINQQLAWLKQTVASGKGRIVKTLGDGFLAVFAEAAQASETALQLQQSWPSMSDNAAALDLKTALTWGEVVNIDNDCYGDAINLASRILALTSAHENLASSDFMDQLPARLQTQFRRLDNVYMRGRVAPVTVWQMFDADFADTAPYSDARTSMMQPAKRICLRVDEHEHIFNHTHAPITLGRSQHADMRLDANHVSRLHAHIDWQQGQFVLIDRSLNGTSVRIDHAKQMPVQLLRRASCTLHGSGLISLLSAVSSPSSDAKSTIRFEISY